MQHTRIGQSKIQLNKNYNNHKLKKKNIWGKNMEYINIIYQYKYIDKEVKIWNKPGEEGQQHNNTTNNCTRETNWEGRPPQQEEDEIQVRLK